MYDPDTVPMPIAPADERHPLHEYLLSGKNNAAPTDEAYEITYLHDIALSEKFKTQNLVCPARLAG